MTSTLAKLYQALWQRGNLTMRTASFPLTDLSVLPPVETDLLGLLDLNPGDKVPCWPRQVYIDSMELVWTIAELIEDIFAFDASTRLIYEGTYLCALPVYGKFVSETGLRDVVAYHGHSRKNRMHKLSLLFDPTGLRGTLMENDSDRIRPCSRNPGIIASYVRKAVALN